MKTVCVKKTEWVWLDFDVGLMELVMWKSELSEYPKIIFSQSPAFIYSLKLFDFVWEFTAQYSHNHSRHTCEHFLLFIHRESHDINSRPKVEFARLTFLIYIMSFYLLSDVDQLDFIYNRENIKNMYWIITVSLQLLKCWRCCMMIWGFFLKHCYYRFWILGSC